MDERTPVQPPKKSHLPLFLLAAVLCAALLLGLWYSFSHKSTLPLTITDPNYSFTVESADLDGEYAYLLVTVKALSDEGRAQVSFPDFGYGLGFFSLQAPGLEPRESFVFDQSFPGVGQTNVVRLSHTEDSCAILLEPQLTAETDKLQVRLDLMEEGLALEVPLTPLPSVSLEIGAAGLGAPNPKKGEMTDFRLQSVTLTPMGCTLSASLDPDAQPRLLFRMADGMVRTSAQMLSSFRRISGTPFYRCRFLERQDLKNIASVIVFDTEYPLDGSAPFPIEHDLSLDPVIVPRGEPLIRLVEDDYPYSYIPLRLKPLMEALGGSYEEDPTTGQVTCTYRDVSLTFDPAAQEITQNGATRSTTTLLYESEEPTPFPMLGVQNGEPVVLLSLVCSSWQLDGFALHSSSIGPADSFGDWYVIP